MPHDIMPEGKYMARATEAAAGRTGTGKEQIAVNFEIIAPEEHKGRRITWFGFLTEKTVDRTLESLEYAGWDGENFGEKSLESIRGEVQLDIIQDEYNGEVRNKVNWVNKLRSLDLKDALSADEAQDLSKKWKGKLLERKSKRPKNEDTSFGFGANEDPP